MTSDQTQPVLVTGASGFLATHIIKQLQEAGHRVRGTVRNIQEEKVKFLWDLCPDALHSLELVEADLTTTEGWTEAVTGCRYVFHIASPYPCENPKDEMDVIGPAVDGTLSVLRGCQEAGGVRRVILTSSVAAVTAGDATGTFNEDDWLDPKTTPMAYYKSKALAERAAWNFVEALPAESRFELTVLNPGYAMGPVLCGAFSTSMEVTKRLLERDIPALPRFSIGVVDVRDVAAAHVVAMTMPEAANKRHILVSKNMWIKEIAEIYDDEFGDFGYKIPLSEAPYVLVKILSFCDKNMQQELPTWGVEASFDTGRMISVLGVRARPIKATLLDMAYSMIERGFIKKTAKYKQLKEKNEQKS